MTSDKAWSTKMSFVFGLCALLGILLLIFTEVGFAQPNGNGFRPGAAPIGNPINDQGMGDEEDDFEEFDDIDNNPVIPSKPHSQNQNPPPSEHSTGGISVGGSQDDKPLPELKRSHKGGFELSGPGTEKAIKSKNEVPTLFVDNESGDGDPASSELITDFNFPDANIMDIAKTLGRLTGKNFILDKDVKGSVSIISNSAITVSDAWRAFLTSLDMNGLAIVPTGKYLRIMRQNDAKAKNVRLYSNSHAPNTDALVTKIFKIKYISAKELENVVRTYTNMGARIYGFEQTNTLIITDTGSNIDKVAKMIRFLDVEGFDAGIEVIAVKFASAVEIQKLIDSLLPGTQANFPGRPGFGGAPGGGGRSNFAARRTKEGGLINNIIADERTNTLIVHANPQGVLQVRELISRLDRKLPAVLGGGKVHVVYLQFAEAEDMAKTLSNFSQSAKGSSGSGPSGGPIGGIGINPNESNLFEGQIKVSPDKTTNSLVITASPADFATIQRVINKLDIPRNQVFVEVVIMEMSMERHNDFSANVLLPGGTSVAPTNDLFNLIKDPTAVGNGLVLHWQDSHTTDFKIQTGTTSQTVSIPNLAALVKAIQTYSGANVLATPQLMTLDNQEATFDSSDQIPIPQINNAGLGIQTASVTYKDVPLTVKIKPQLNKISNFIKMDINVKASDISNKAVAKAVQDQASALLSRSINTSVMVADTDTVVLGGLIRDKTSEVINKVPLLGDIPILGWLFKSRSAAVEKTNLMLFITPRIIRQPENVRMVLDKKLKERDEFVEKAFGGEDAHREARNKIIRDLPDVKTIKGYNTKRVLNLEDDDEPGKEMPKDTSMNDMDSSGKINPPSTTPDTSHETLTLPAPETTPEAAPVVQATPAKIPEPKKAPVVVIPPKESPKVASPSNSAPSSINQPANGTPTGDDPFALPVPGTTQ